MLDKDETQHALRYEKESKKLGFYQFRKGFISFKKVLYL